MALPTVDTVFPNDGSEGVPLGANIEITFNQGIDLRLAKANIVLYGPDFDKTSGPDSALWIERSGNNPNFLKSPGFTGTVKCDYEVVYVDQHGDLVDPQPVVTAQIQEANNQYRHKLLVKPKSLLAADTKYTLYIIGDSEGGPSRGISKRTVFEPVKVVTDDAATMLVYGTYKRELDDKAHIKFTTAGDVGEAKYKWWYESEGEASAVTGKVTSRRFRRLNDGIQVRFTGSSYSLNDLFTLTLATREHLENSYALSFLAGSGSVLEVPSTTSTSVIGREGPAAAPDALLTLVDMEPEDGSTHMPLDTRTINIEFSEELDPDTITGDNVTVFAYPVSGRFGTKKVVELVKKLTVDGSVLKIEI